MEFLSDGALSVLPEGHEISPDFAAGWHLEGSAQRDLFYAHKGQALWRSRLDASTYSRTVLDRARWYQQQDDLTPEQRASLFVSLFRDSDRLQVRQWLEREQPEFPYTHPKRDRKSELFNAILDRARAAGDLIGIDPILDYCLPNKEEPESPDRDQYLTDYRFNILPHLQFGCEGSTSTCSWRAVSTRRTAPDCLSVRLRRCARIRRRAS